MVNVLNTDVLTKAFVVIYKQVIRKTLFTLIHVISWVIKPQGQSTLVGLWKGSPRFLFRKPWNPLQVSFRGSFLLKVGHCPVVFQALKLRNNIEIYQTMLLKEIIAPRTSKHQIRLESPRVRRVKVTKSTGASWPSGHSRWSIYLITYTCIVYNAKPCTFWPRHPRSWFVPFRTGAWQPLNIKHKRIRVFELQI